jgi:hypothetical protein
MEVGLNFRVILIFVSIILSSSVVACVVPTQGKEYDELVEVSWNKEESSFYILFPKEANGQKFDNVTLGLLKGDKPFASKSAPLQTYPKNGKLLTYVRSFDDLDIGLNVSVWWQGENDVCPIIGKAKLVKK